MTHKDVPKCQASTGTGIVGWIVTFVLILVATMLWTQTRKTKKALMATSVDPAIKDPTIEQLNYMEMLSMILVVVPVIVAIISFIAYMGNKAKNAIKNADSDDSSSKSSYSSGASGVDRGNNQGPAVVMVDPYARRFGGVPQTLRCAPVHVR